MPEKSASPRLNIGHVDSLSLQEARTHLLITSVGQAKKQFIVSEFYTTALAGLRVP